MTEHLSDLQLDALRLGTAEPGVGAHVEACERCQRRRDALAADAEAFSSRFDPAQLAARTRARAEGSRGTRRPGWWAFGGVSMMAAAAAATLLIVAPGEETRTKGDGARVEIYAPRDDEPRPVGGAVEPGAHLWVRVAVPGPRRVRLLWSPAPGGWTPLFPPARDPAWAVEGPAWLEREVVLDGELATERLGAVFLGPQLRGETRRQLEERTDNGDYDKPIRPSRSPRSSTKGPFIPTIAHPLHPL
jgi:hypothetical protein